LAAACLCSLQPVSGRAADAPPPVAEELTLDGLGIGTQTVFGAHAVVETYFPPPVTNLATAGTYVRVYFGHSPQASQASTALIAVNGQPLVTVPLQAGTAGGGVLDVRIPPTLVDARLPNRLQVRFDLQASGIAPGELYGRVTGATMMHYELVGRGGAPGLETYPYALLPSQVLDPAVGLVLPSAPDPGELASALRLMADLGRRAASQHVRPEVVTADQTAWLASATIGAIMVGRLDRLPAAQTFLDAQGWKRGAKGWTAPDGTALAIDDGLIAAAVSPWNPRVPVVLVSGGSDAAVARAVSALLAPADVPLAGPYAVVATSAAAAGSPPAADRAVRLSLLSPRGLAALGPGRYRTTESFAAPAVGQGDTGVLQLDVPPLAGVTSASGTVEADIDGSRVTAASWQLGSTRPIHLQVDFSGGLLHPGRNALTLDFRIDQPAPGGNSLDSPLTNSQSDAATATLSLPLNAPSTADLRMLPYPFFEGSDQAPTLVLLANGSATTLTAAAQAMVALGSRSATPPPAFKTAFARGWSPSSDDRGLIVVGASGLGSLATLGSALPVRFDAGGQVTLKSASLGAAVGVATRLGAVQEAQAAGGGRQVLWLDGTGGEMLTGAAAALYDTRLSGGAAVVDAAGRLTLLGGAPPTLNGRVTGPPTAVVAALAAAVLLLGVLVLQLLWPRRAEQ
jgi:hypothetical protein